MMITYASLFWHHHSCQGIPLKQIHHPLHLTMTLCGYGHFLPKLAPLINNKNFTFMWASAIKCNKLVFFICYGIIKYYNNIFIKFENILNMFSCPILIALFTFK
jgi:hypothetical protein